MSATKTAPATVQVEVLRAGHGQAVGDVLDVGVGIAHEMVRSGRGKVKNEKDPAWVKFQSRLKPTAAKEPQTDPLADPKTHKRLVSEEQARQEREKKDQKKPKQGFE